MKLSIAVVVGLAFAFATVAPVSADPLNDMFRSFGQAKKKPSGRKAAKRQPSPLEQAIGPMLLGTAIGGLAGGVAGGGKGAGAGMAVGAGVGLLIALEGARQQEQANVRGDGSRSERIAPKRLSERDVERETWRRIQERLNALGFDAGPADGSPGRRTRSAVESFQASVGHDVTGELTPEQTALLYASVPAGGDVEATVTSVAGPAAPSAGAASGVDPAPGDLIINPVPATAGQAPPTEQRVSATLPGAGRRAVAPPSAVLGVRPLSDLAEAETILRDDYGACERTGAALVCSAEREGGLADTLVLGYATDGERQVIHTVSRRLTFWQPMARGDVIGQLAAPYPDLVFVPQMTLASTRDCVIEANAFQARHFEPLLDWARSGATADDEIALLAGKCDFHYSLDVPPGERVTSVAITLFNGTPIRQALAGGEATTGEPPRIRF